MTLDTHLFDAAMLKTMHERMTKAEAERDAAQATLAAARAADDLAAAIAALARVRAEALEEAAQIAESAINPFEGHRDWDQDNAYYSAADHIAAAIRALEPKP